jgi:2-hydroxy-6-oxonona-2,4-dienedioate hydrolase
VVYYNRLLAFFAPTVASLIAVGFFCTFGVPRFYGDLKIASNRAARSSMLVATRCGPIEYQEAGTGTPLLMVHGRGGEGIIKELHLRVAWHRRILGRLLCLDFGYLRTPMHVDSSCEVQADAHACLLDASRISTAAVVGGSAGGPSALQMAIRHPDRVSALVLLVPLAYKPSSTPDSAKHLARWAESMLMNLIGSDFLFWVGLHVARDNEVMAEIAELVLPFRAV